MNVGVLCFASAGGSGTVATGLACELARQGHAVHVIAPARPFRLDTLPNGIRFHALRADGDPAAAARSAASISPSKLSRVLPPCGMTWVGMFAAWARSSPATPSTLEMTRMIL